MYKNAPFTRACADPFPGHPYGLRPGIFVFPALLQAAGKQQKKTLMGLEPIRKPVSAGFLPNDVASALHPATCAAPALCATQIRWRTHGTGLFLLPSPGPCAQAGASTPLLALCALCATLCDVRLAACAARCVIDCRSRQERSYRADGCPGSGQLETLQAVPTIIMKKLPEQGVRGAYFCIIAGKSRAGEARGLSASASAIILYHIISAIINYHYLSFALVSQSDKKPAHNEPVSPILP